MILDVLAKFIEIVITYNFHNRFSGLSGRMLFPH